MTKHQQKEQDPERKNKFWFIIISSAGLIALMTMWVLGRSITDITVVYLAFLGLAAYIWSNKR